MRTGRLLWVIDTEHREDPPEAARAFLRVDERDGMFVSACKVAWHRDIGGNRKAFVPLTGGEPYGVRSIAVCSRGCGGPVPNLGCTCGFYALPGESEAAILARGVQQDAYLQLEEMPWDRVPVVLDVALSGRVAAFQAGDWGTVFRAERQVVRGWAHPWSFADAIEWKGRRQAETVPSKRRPSEGDDGQAGATANPYEPVPPQPGSQWKPIPTSDLRWELIGLPGRGAGVESGAV